MPIFQIDGYILSNFRVCRRRYVYIYIYICHRCIHVFQHVASQAGRQQHELTARDDHAGSAGAATEFAEGGIYIYYRCIHVFLYIVDVYMFQIDGYIEGCSRVCRRRYISHRGIHIFQIDGYIGLTLDGNNKSSPLAMTTQEVLELLQSLQKEGTYRCIYTYIYICIYIYIYIESLIPYNSHHNRRAQSRETVPRQMDTWQEVLELLQSLQKEVKIYIYCRCIPIFQIAGGALAATESAEGGIYLIDVYLYYYISQTYTFILDRWTYSRRGSSCSRVCRRRYIYQMFACILDRWYMVGSARAATESADGGEYIIYHRCIPIFQINGCARAASESAEGGIYIYILQMYRYILARCYPSWTATTKIRRSR